MPEGERVIIQWTEGSWRAYICGGDPDRKPTRLNQLRALPMRLGETWEGETEQYETSQETGGLEPEDDGPAELCNMRGGLRAVPTRLYIFGRLQRCVRLGELGAEALRGTGAARELESEYRQRQERGSRGVGERVLPWSSTARK